LYEIFPPPTLEFRCLLNPLWSFSSLARYRPGVREHPCRPILFTAAPFFSRRDCGCFLVILPPSNGDLTLKSFSPSQAHVTLNRDHFGCTPPSSEFALFLLADLPDIPPFFRFCRLPVTFSWATTGWDMFRRKRPFLLFLHKPPELLCTPSFSASQKHVTQKVFLKCMG